MCSFSKLFFYIYQLRIGKKSAFESHYYRSVQISVILSNLKIQKKIVWNYFVIFNQTTKIDTHKEKYFHSNSFKWFSQTAWTTCICESWYHFKWKSLDNLPACLLSTISLQWLDMIYFEGVIAHFQLQYFIKEFVHATIDFYYLYMSK
jgi:hypothetical protein